MNRHKGHTILLVEDDLADVELTLVAFRNTPFDQRIAVAADGQAALDYLFSTGRRQRTDGEFPIVVLLDLKLPKVDGTEVLKKIRENKRTKALPVFILTGSDHKEDLLECYSYGCNGYIAKPVTFENFSRAIQPSNRSFLKNFSQTGGFPQLVSLLHDLQFLDGTTIMMLEVPPTTVSDRDALHYYFGWLSSQRYLELETTSSKPEYSTYRITPKIGSLFSELKKQA